MYWIGFVIGSSSVKASLISADDGHSIDMKQYPKKEMSIKSIEPEWAEQDSKFWWHNLCKATKNLISKNSIDKNNN